MNKWTSESAIGMNLWVLLKRYFDSQILERPDAENSYYKALSNCVGIVSLVFEMLCLFRATNKVLFKFRVMIINFVRTKILLFIKLLR